LQKQKKILSILIKLLIGIGSFLIIYFRLKSDFTPDKINLITQQAFSLRGLSLAVLCFLLIPINWGIEAYKWRLITKPIQDINYKTATKSVYAGVCLGNLAPGRATEFLAKILFFKIENRPHITVLHFIGGMFQLSITIIAGFFALIFELKHLQGSSTWLMNLTMGIGVVLLITLIVCIYKIDRILHLLAKKIRKGTNIVTFNYKFTPKMLIQLFGFSALRYCVFFLQFFLLIYIFHPSLTQAILPGIALYFLITTVLPMISAVEAAIRAAIALLVFKNSGISDSVLALSSVLIWLVNIIIPSIFGYYILWRQNFNFKLFKKER
jgi:hypothetical protein